MAADFSNLTNPNLISSSDHHHSIYMNNNLNPNPQFEQTPYQGFQIDPFESRIDAMNPNLALIHQNSAPISLDSSLSDMPTWPISCNGQILGYESSGPDFLDSKPENGGGPDQDSAFLDALMPELAEMAKGLEFGIFNAPVLQEQDLDGDGGLGSGFGPLPPSHIKNISSLMATFVPPPPPSAASLPPVSYLPPLPGSFGTLPSSWAHNHD